MIHGGGLFIGGTADQHDNPSFMVQNSVEMNKPMIGISIHYRLSAYGFLGGKDVIGRRKHKFGLQRPEIGIAVDSREHGSFWG